MTDWDRMATEEKKTNTLKNILLLISGLLLFSAGIYIFYYQNIMEYYNDNFKPHPQLGDHPIRLAEKEQGSSPQFIPKSAGVYVFECGKLREMNSRNSTKIKQECLRSIGKGTK